MGSDNYYKAEENERDEMVWYPCGAGLSLSGWSPAPENSQTREKGRWRGRQRPNSFLAGGSYPHTFTPAPLIKTHSPLAHCISSAACSPPVPWSRPALRERATSVVTRTSAGPVCPSIWLQHGRGCGGGGGQLQQSECSVHAIIEARRKASQPGT